MTFAKPNPWPTPVFVNEFNAGILESATNCGIIGRRH
jgi:hypothetical protein